MFESGKEDFIFNCFGILEYLLYKYVLICVLYCGFEFYWCYCNEKVKEDIENYFFCKNI